MQAYYVTGIGTEVGKTVTSALLCRALNAAYWKPIQAGDLANSDSIKVQKWAQLEDQDVFPEAHRLQTPASPHYAAAQDGLCIYVSQINLPLTTKPLIVEGAGGLLVPLNEQETNLDLVEHLGIPVLLVARNYLGSINHTLLSLRLLKARNIPLAGLIYSGDNYLDNIEIISQHSGVAPLIQIPEIATVDAAIINDLAQKYRATLVEQIV